MIEELSNRQANYNEFEQIKINSYDSNNLNLYNTNESDITSMNNKDINGDKDNQIFNDDVLLHESFDSQDHTNDNYLNDCSKID